MSADATAPGDEYGTRRTLSTSMQIGVGRSSTSTVKTASAKAGGYLYTLRNGRSDRLYFYCRRDQTGPASVRELVKK